MGMQQLIVLKPRRCSSKRIQSCRMNEWLCSVFRIIAAVGASENYIVNYHFLDFHGQKPSEQGRVVTG
jgi:hypothetical protein